MSREAKASTQQEAQWREQRRQNVARYKAACEALSAAIVEHAGDFLIYRARVIAGVANRGPLPAAAEAVIEAEGVAFAEAMRDGLERVPWLVIAPWLRGRRPDDTAPSEIAPLATLADGFLRLLSTSHGYPLHPGGLSHQPLDSGAWPDTRQVHERRITAAARLGFLNEPQFECVVVARPHPVIVKFRAVADAAMWVDQLDVREAREKVIA